MRRLPCGVMYLVFVMTLAQSDARAADEYDWNAGVASVVITPSQPMWMAGYASRTKPSDGVLSELHAKALVLEDKTGTRAVIVTTDLISIPRVLREGGYEGGGAMRYSAL